MDIKEELIRTAEQIRKKYRALKRGKESIEEERVESLKPVIEPLKGLVGMVKSSVSNTSLPVAHIPEIEAAPHMKIGNVASHYLSMHMSKGKHREGDTTYGVRYEGRNYKIGNKQVLINGNDLVINGVTYKGTPGLWELIVSKTPKSYTEDDLDEYKRILEQTSAHTKLYKPDASINAGKQYKYTHIIAPLFSRKEGEGMRIASNQKIEQTYWNDPNELVDKLRLLHYSQLAGNTGTHNEMESIVEELIEENIIFYK